MGISTKHPMKHFVAVAGNIGVGKSSLTERLAEKLGWEPFYEAVEENPYLADFYGDMARWSFHSQVFFLSRRLRHHHALLEHPGSVLQDRTVYEDAEIFARNLYRQGHMSEREWQTYHALYSSIADFLPPPDLVVYLRASVPTLLTRIGLRGRDFERGISPQYLSQLNELYGEWAGSFSLCPVLTVETDHIDFVQFDEHMEQIARRIEDRLRGKETIEL
jgi:deoxyadenosine/deoxycytidine kinase